MASRKLVSTYCAYFISSYTELHAIPGTCIFPHDTFAWAIFHLLECSSIYVYQNPTHPFNVISSLKTFLVAHEGNLPFRTSGVLYIPPLFIPHSPYINFVISQDQH